jgi:CHAD domain-containing protein
MARDAAGAALLRAMLNCTLQQVLANASEVAEGRDEAERVHQLRVGLRRLRTVLRELQPLSPAIDPAWEPELAEVFAELGEVRDDEAVADAVRPLLMAAGAPSSDWAPRAPTDLAAVVRRTGFQLTLLRLLALAHADDEHLSSAGPADTRRFVAQQLAELHRQVSRAGKRFERLTLEQQHRARKRLKRLRYLAELAQPLWPRKAVQRYLEALEPAQDALGRHNDVATAAAKFRREAAQDPRAWYAAGYLEAHLALTAKAARKALEQVRDATVFWKD